MSRETCYRCFWPKPLCWCSSIQPIAPRTKFVFLMHPKEFKQEKAATGRLAHLCLTSSEIHMGVSFENDEAVNALIRDPRHLAVLLYPGPNARNLSNSELSPVELGSRQLVVFLLDATWACARKMLRLSPTLQQLPRIMFTPSTPSRYVIKQQPQPGCLSTLEAVHETLTALERSGLDRYDRPEQLLTLFARMQDYQIRCAQDPSRRGYRRQPYSDPAERTAARGDSARRSRYLPI
ncbi:MAG TPA: tRNA-uridine aminocarboxypropyltransferase [Opitutus sp.]|nr:tRNA-uridine aminocarboxypropyltransferase [Opitutus sp.]